MLSNYQDVTLQFVANAGVVLDMSGWDNIIIQIVGRGGTIDITASNNGGGLAGTTTGGPDTATDFQTVQATKLSDGTAVTTAATDGLYRVGVVGRYVKFGGSGATATSVIVEFYKIS